MPTKREKLQQLRQSSFIGRQRELNLFRSLLPLDRTTPIDVLVIYGMGGIGKSELLDQFRLLARDEAVPVAKIDPQAYPTIFDFLVAMYKQLNSQISFPQFEEGLKRHQEIESRIIGHADVPKTVLRMFARGAHAALKLAPGVNLVAEIVSSEQIESAMSAVYNLVGRKEADFWMRPDDELTDRLVADLNAYSTQQRLVLLIDTYELIGTFDEWVRERLFAGLGEHALLVIAGRHRLTGKGWQEYAALMRQVALQPLSTSEAQVYLYKKGIIDPQVASAMVDYADGHPLTLMLLSELADHVQVADLAHTPERRQVIHSLLERITQNVAASLRAALEMCAVLRIVNEDSLAYMLDLSDGRQIFDEVQKFDFMKVRNGGIALHDTVWSAMNEELCWRNPTHYRALNGKAGQFYERGLAQPIGQERERFALERLYHSIQADEASGIRLFQEMAEELVHYRLLNRLRVLLKDMSSYDQQQGNSRQWQDYYKAVLAQLEGRLHDAARSLEVIVDHQAAEQKLRAYALYDLGLTFRLLNEHERAIPFLKRSLTIVPLDAKLALSLLELGGAFRRIGDLDKGLNALERARDYYAQTGNNYGLAITLNRLKYYYLNCGLMHEARTQRNASWEAFRSLSPEPLFLKMELLGGVAIIWAWCGWFSTIEQELREALDIAQRLELINVMYFTRDLGYIVGMTGRYAEADSYFAQSIAAAQKGTGGIFDMSGAVMAGFRGAVLTRQGRLSEAEDDLLKSLRYKLPYDVTGLPEVYLWLGELSEIKASNSSEKPEAVEFLSAAVSYYDQAYELRSIGRQYFVSGALTGLARVRYAQGNYAAIPPLMVEAERLASQHEYNNFLAALYLLQGHIAWDGHLADYGVGFDTALRHYQRTLIFALRYNRFLLDEVVSGRPHGTPLQPIIPYCLERTFEGQQMLLALKDWWTSAANDSGVPRANTISPIPEGISLIDGECLAREHERGDGNPQPTVVNQLRLAIQ